jgi:hypothetical protein
MKIGNRLSLTASRAVLALALVALAGGQNRTGQAAGPDDSARPTAPATAGPDPVPAATTATYYVDAATGCDTNAGTALAPWKTLAKAARTLVAGDTCLIRTGVYRETVVPANSGAPGSPITYKADAGATVTISGCEAVTGAWAQHAGNIYKTPVALPLGDGNQVFVDGNMMIDARWPNTPSPAASNDWLLHANLALATSGNELTPTRFSLKEDAVGPIDPTGAVIWVTPFQHHGWCNYTGEVRAYDATARAITFELPKAIGAGWEICKVSTPGHDKNTRSNYYLFGKLGYLDIEKEYFYDRAAGMLYLYQPGGGQPATGAVQYKVRENGIDLSGRKFITMEGISLFGCTLKTGKGSSNIVIDKLKARYISHWSSARCEVLQPTSTPASGIQLEGDHLELRNSEIAGSSGDGVSIRGDDILVVNNLITDCNYLGVYHYSLNLRGGKRSVVSYNTLLRSGRTLLGGYPHDGRITHNHMAYANLYSADGAGIYLSYVDGANSEIAYNYVHDSGPTMAACDIYLDAINSNLFIHHNYIGGMLINSPSSYSVLANNTIVGGGLTLGGKGNAQEDGWIGMFAINNIIRPSVTFSGIATPVRKPIIQSMNWVPLVKRGDWEGNDPKIFESLNWAAMGSGDAKLLADGTLASDSPCRNPPGVPRIASLHDAVTDHMPDLGAFEYGLPPWPYGHDFTVNRTVQYTAIDCPLLNRVQNPGFDEAGWNGGKLTGWTDNGNLARGEGARSMPGSYCSAEIRPGSSIEQTLTGLRAGSRYLLGAWSRTELNGQPAMAVTGHGGAEVTVTGSYAADLSWRFNKLTFTTGPDSTTATISLKNQGTGLVHWDCAGVTLEDMPVRSVP